MDGGTLQAHGIGGAQDLPISPSLAIAGAVAALAVSFVVLARAWRRPRYADRSRQRPAPAWLASAVDSTAWRVVVRLIGLAFFVYTVIAAVLGKDLLINPVFGIFYVWVWVGNVPLSLLFGRAWRALSPWRTLNAGLARLSGSDPERGLYDLPERLGYWPAAVGLFAFVWMELVYPNGTSLGPVRLWCAVYVGLMLVGGALFGDRFYARADPFEVYSSLVAKMSVWGRDAEGLLVVRSPLANLDTTTVRPGLLAVAATLFGSTAFDSFRDSQAWLQFTVDTGMSVTLLNNLALLVFCVGVGLVFWVGCVATGVGPEQRRRDLPNQFAHSIIPIVVGYVVAHYLTYFVEVGQQTLIYASDPLSNGANLFGTADWTVSYALSYHPSVLATTKVLAVVVGHVVGVIAAHERAITLLPKKHQLTGQLPLLFAMVAFTVGGLYLLFSA